MNLTCGDWFMVSHILSCLTMNLVCGDRFIHGVPHTLLKNKPGRDETNLRGLICGLPQWGMEPDLYQTGALSWGRLWCHRTRKSAYTTCTFIGGWVGGKFSTLVFNTQPTNDVTTNGKENHKHKPHRKFWRCSLIGGFVTAFRHTGAPDQSDWPILNWRVDLGNYTKHFYSPWSK